MNEYSHKNQTLVIELLTEELPPRYLLNLSKNFSDTIIKELSTNNLISGPLDAESFATPRRLAVMIKNVLPVAAKKIKKHKIMPSALASNDNGTPSVIFKKKIATLGLSHCSLENFEKSFDGKIEYLYHTETTCGTDLKSSLQTACQKILEKMSSYQKMHYQLDNDTLVSFIRPAINLMVLHGKNIIDINMLGLKANNKTFGHRFLCHEEIVLENAESYETTLADKGKVIACYTKRRNKIIEELNKLAKNKCLVTSDALLEEVTALVEWPCVYKCHFEKHFLSIPQECLILIMQTQQRYFGLSDQNGQLISSFLVVSNIETDKTEYIISGNERVIGARFADAKFFFEQDLLFPLTHRINDLKHITYHHKLGSQADKVKRLQIITDIIWNEYKSIFSSCQYQDIAHAVMLAKADLTTNMVTEFSELQGIMGKYYALANKESIDIANACAEHYLPRYAGDAIPHSQLGKFLAISDKLEILLSLTITEGLPKNDKDPMALRRHALGLMRIIIEGEVNIDILKILDLSFTSCVKHHLLPIGNNPCNIIYTFCIERLRNYFHDKNFSWQEINAVLPNTKTSLLNTALPNMNSLVKKLTAIQYFYKLDQAREIIAIHKRVYNILDKNGKLKAEQNTIPFDQNIANQPAEIHLANKIKQLTLTINNDLINEDFISALQHLIELHQPINVFFDQVLVNVQDKKIKNNRLHLLNQAYQLMNILQISLH